MRAAFSSNAAASRCVRNRSRASAAAAISVLANPRRRERFRRRSERLLRRSLRLGRSASARLRLRDASLRRRLLRRRRLVVRRRRASFLLRPRLGDVFRLLERLRRRAFPREGSPKRLEFCALRRRSGERRFAGFVRRSRLRRRALRLARFLLHHHRRRHRSVLRGDSRGLFSLELGGERVANLAEIGEDGDVASGAFGVAFRALGDDAPQHRLHPRVARARGDGEGGDTTGGGI